MLETLRCRKLWPHRLRYLMLAGGVALAALGVSAESPVAINDSAFHYGPPVVVDVLTNDTEADGDVLSVAVQSVDTCGQGLSVVHQLIRFAPPDGAPTSCSMTYRVTDEDGGEDTAQLSFMGVDGEIFSDGFESGNTNAWSFVCIGC